MKHHRSLAWMIFICMWILPLAVLAQDSCPSIVESALKAVDEACNATGRNQACYGNIQLVAEMQADASDVVFKQRGDIADIGKIKTIILSALNAQTDEWGVALMKVQANLPDTLPGQNVTMLMFGDVTITDARESAPPPILLDVTALGSANLRGGPSTSEAILGTLSNGQFLKADGRNEAGDWLRVQLEDGTAGWVATRLVTASGDVTTLPVKANNEAQAVAAAAQFGPMQSFYFKTGIGDAPCKEAPDSGILIQTPQGAGQITLSVNGADISLGSTGYFQAQPNGEMTISIVEGQGTVTAQGVTSTVPAGSRVRVPVDANGVASGPPSSPEPYDAAALAALPVANLPVQVTIAPALTAEEIASAATSLPKVGKWTSSAEITSDCDFLLPSYGFADATVEVQVGLSEVYMLPHYDTINSLYAFFIWPTSFTTTDAPPSSQYVAAATQDTSGAYVFTANPGGAEGDYVVRIVSPTHIEGTTTIHYPLSCTSTATYTMDYAGG